MPLTTVRGRMNSTPRGKTGRPVIEVCGRLKSCLQKRPHRPSTASRLPYRTGQSHSGGPRSGSTEKSISTQLFTQKLDEDADLGRDLPGGRKNGMYVEDRRTCFGQHTAQASRIQFNFDHPLRQAGDAQPRDRGFLQGKQVVAAIASGNRYGLVDTGACKSPFAGVELI